ncbi:hypothetical protein [Egbenema bharatensis]|uniref:hypothetical protein n=1 Tax=Egbenema bharatensis TaxID=3463334 RepID=UPI003A895AB6
MTDVVADSCMMQQPDIPPKKNKRSKWSPSPKPPHRLRSASTQVVIRREVLQLWEDAP